ncbi:hypothetical protein KEM60_02627 [Austwickia sp. TVS 96-490-7B]|uniref:ABC transporter permease subunit n=1 Tax=Austwickia sp. TVS 96-490-7B TaxID=2830843 RepID=UPI001C597D2E|nr:ABC transporter permease subunit [Austwickia sp. TVS 96-490-7B]MBW3086409.1 hypothetical protein [Austwickia sp. TVS 96-490-7B]
MMRLWRVELTRIRSRPLTWMVALLSVLLLAMMLTDTWQQTMPVSPAEQRQADQAFSQAKAEFEEHGEQEKAACRQAQEDVNGRFPQTRIDCSDIAPRPENFIRRIPPFHEIASSTLGDIALLLGMFSLFLGASWVAAEFSTGSISTYLLHEPRRSRVFLSKITATATAVLIGTATLTIVMLAAMAATAQIHGMSLAVSGQAIQDVATAAARVVGLSVLTALGGAATAFVLRHSAAVLGASFTLLVVDSWGASMLSEYARWTLLNNVQAFAKGSWQFHFSRYGQNADGSPSYSWFSETIWFAQGCGVLVGLTALVLMLGWWSFARRDVP